MGQYNIIAENIKGKNKTPDEIFFDTIKTTSILKFRKKLVDAEDKPKDKWIYLKNSHLEKIFLYPKYNRKDSIERLLKEGIIEQKTDYGKGKIKSKYYTYRIKDDKYYEDATFDLSLVKMPKLDLITSKVATHLSFTSLDVDKHDIDTSLKDYLKYFFEAEDKRYFVSKDIFGHRIHHPLTLVSKNVRPHITLFGQKTNFVDIPQSQPSLLSYFLKKQVGDNTFSEILDNGGDIYELINKEDRDKGKKQFYELLYGRNPNISHIVGEKGEKWVNELKKTEIQANPSTNGNHTNLAWLLQNKESEVMHKVFNQLSYPFIPIHDEVIVMEQNIEDVTEKLREVLTEEGIKTGL